MNEIISQSILDLIKYFVLNQLSFSITVDNNNNWDNELPLRLKEVTRFRLDMKNTDLSDSYVEKNGDIIIVAGIDNLIYTKVIEACDVHSIGEFQKEPLIIKQFVEKPQIIREKKLTETENQSSMDAMRKHNPKYFIRKIKDKND